MPRLEPLNDIAAHHTDSEVGLRLCFSTNNPKYTARFATYSTSEVFVELAQRLKETDLRSTLVVLARTEAAFRTDYLERCHLKLSDNISIAFRGIHKRRGRKARLDKDILDVWSANVDPSTKAMISKFKGMLVFRHWLAHGRYWNAGAKYNFQDAYLLADLLLTNLPLVS